MVTNRLALTAVGLACVAAAGGGSYLATRHNVAQVAVQSASASPAGIATQAPEPTATASVSPVTVAAPSEVAVALPQPQSVPREGSQPPARIQPAARVPSSATRHDDDRAGVERIPSPAPSPDVTVTDMAEPLPARTTGEGRSVDVPPVPEQPVRAFEELIVAADSVIGLQTEGLLTSERARVEDRVEARVSRDVRVGGEVAIPAGARALGAVVVVERGGRMRDRARLGIRFQTLLLPDGTSLPITTETIYRFGEAPSNGSAAKIGGGAVAGAILGAIIGGGRGAAIGATTGAGAGTAAVMTGERKAAVFPPGADVTARILSAITITVEH